MNEEKPSVAKNYLYNLSYQLLLLVTPLVTMPYIARILGVENNGLFDFIQAIVCYFVLFGTIGLNIYGQREIAFCRDDIQRRSKVFAELILLRAVTVTVSLAIFYAAVVSQCKEPRLYAIYSVEIVAALFDVSWFFQGMENFRIQTIRNFAVKLSGVVLIFLFVRTEDDLDLYILCMVLTSLIGNLSVWPRLFRYLRPVPLRKLEILRHLVPALTLFFPQIATSIYTQLDKTMLGLLANDAQVGYYGKAEKIVKTALTVVTSLGLVMLSRVATLYSKNEKEKLRDYVDLSYRFCCLLSFPILFGLCAIAPRFAVWFLGEGYEPVSSLIITLSPIVFFIGASGVFGTQYLLPTKQMRSYTISILAGTFSNLALNALLIPKWGAYGAAAATVVAEALVLAVQLFLIRSVYRVSVRSGSRSFFAAAIMGGIVYWLGELFSRRMLGTFFQILCGIGIYAGLLLLFREPLFLQISREAIGTVKKKLARKKS